MRQVYIVSFISILPLLIVGCGSQPSETSTSVPPSPPPVLPKISPSPNSSQPPAPGTTATTGTKVASVNVGLIPSTNAEVRTKSVAAGVRTDPFRSLVVTPEIKIDEDSEAARSAGNGGNAAIPSFMKPSVHGLGGTPLGKPGAGGKPTAGSPGQVGSPSTNKPGAKPDGSKSGEPKAPPLPPSTELAKAVQVTGVAQVGQSVVAILRAPDEPTSRNVQAGERVSNGQVLVKRISVGIGGNPIVVLEQNGVEVIKTLSNSPSVMG